jgi:hypothetical protein
MSTVLSMLSLNVPLSQWRKFEADGRKATSWHYGKNTDKVAQAIFSQLSHDETVALVARDFAGFASDLRVRLRTLCNDGNATGNVRKGVQKLDRMMNGQLLREVKQVEHFQAKTRDGWKSKVVNPAVAGATRKYGILK